MRDRAQAQHAVARAAAAREAVTVAAETHELDLAAAEAPQEREELLALIDRAAIVRRSDA